MYTGLEEVSQRFASFVENVRQLLRNFLYRNRPTLAFTASSILNTYSFVKWRQESTWNYCVKYCNLSLLFSAHCISCILSLGWSMMFFMKYLPKGYFYPFGTIWKCFELQGCLGSSLNFVKKRLHSVYCQMIPIMQTKWTNNDVKSIWLCWVSQEWPCISSTTLKRLQ